MDDENRQEDLRRLAVPFAEDDMRPYDEPALREIGAQIRACMEALGSGDQRRVFELRFFRELGNREVARELGQNEKTTATWYFRAMQSVKDCLKRKVGV